MRDIKQLCREIVGLARAKTVTGNLILSTDECEREMHTLVHDYICCIEKASADSPPAAHHGEPSEEMVMAFLTECGAVFDDQISEVGLRNLVHDGLRAALRPSASPQHPSPLALTEAESDLDS